MNEEPRYRFFRHPSISFLRNARCCPRRSYRRSSRELPVLSLAYRLFRVFPRITPSFGCHCDFSRKHNERLPFLSFSLFSTYQPQRIRPDLYARSPVTTTYRPKRCHLRGFLLPPWWVALLAAYAVLFHTASTLEVFATAI
jgi:hypothetical protein